ncbi:sulfur oxidation c-type cytochrome SoxA [Congregibacter litoralis]|uniref:SoxAX cytochrome complex subunit A n=1 Tax=Congregibacter litoralis KT71 TaxID=314285 RepID=A4A7K3_9GAMM|nr:sulfur oxidation c-type cytochrome SoxA [Congregibacter litoralis]EAQ98272.2 diheme cytochrome SoxA (sulfur oxidation) [Congregibacter litoralis KT71]
MPGNLKQGIYAGLIFAMGAAAIAGPEEDRSALRAFYEQRFPGVELDAHVDGAYALDADKREQWLEMEDFPPYEIAIDDGADLYETPLADGSSYAECLGEGAPVVKQHFPRFDAQSGQVETLEQRINSCRTAAGDEPWDYLGTRMSSLMAFIAYESRDETLAIEVPDDPRAQAAYEDGKEFFYTRRGQLNFACSSCHVSMVGNALRAERLSAALGHATHWPVYRLKWKEVGPLHKRFIECNSQVRAVPLEAQSESYRNLEYFLTYMSNGMALNGPASRK